MCNQFRASWHERTLFALSEFIFRYWNAGIQCVLEYMSIGNISYAVECNIFSLRKKNYIEYLLHVVSLTVWMSSSSCLAAHPFARSGHTGSWGNQRGHLLHIEEVLPALLPSGEGITFTRKKVIPFQKFSWIKPSQTYYIHSENLNTVGIVFIIPKM